jgi:hypothetical protein
MARMPTPADRAASTAAGARRTPRPRVIRPEPAVPAIQTTGVKMQEMTTMQIREAIDAAQSAYDAIKAQINEAKRKSRAENIWANHEWLTSAEKAMKWKARNMTKLRTMLSESLKKEKQENAKKSAIETLRFERLFMKSAKSILHADVYQQLLLLTTEEMRSEQCTTDASQAE